jgi:hypothetical protein
MCNQKRGRNELLHFLTEGHILLLVIRSLLPNALLISGVPEKVATHVLTAAERRAPSNHNDDFDDLHDLPGLSSMAEAPDPGPD